MSRYVRTFRMCFSNMFSATTLLAFLASCAFALAGVQDLNPAQFDSLVAAPSVSVVLFYAPWCTYSKAFMPVFESIGAHFESSDNNVLIGRVNGEDIAAAHLLAARGIVSFPTVLLFAAGRSHPQENFDRTFDSIVLHVHRMRLPLVPLINSDAALDELASLGHMQALLLFPSSSSEASHVATDAPVETVESSSQSEVSDSNSSTSSHQSSVLRPNLPSLSSADATLRFDSSVCFPDSNVKPLISAIGALAELNSGYSFGVVTNTTMIMRLLRLAGIAGISGTNNLPPAMECRPWLVIARQPGLSIYSYPSPTAHIPASSSQPMDLSSISSTLFTSAMESELPASVSQSFSNNNVAARSATPIAASSMPTPVEWRRVSAWLKQVGVPLVGEFNRATAAAYVAKPLPLLVLFLDSSISAEDADSQAALSLMRIVAPEFAHRVSFVYADALTFAEQLLRIGGDPLQLPALWFDDYQRTPYALAYQYFSPDHLRSSVNQTSEEPLPVWDFARLRRPDLLRSFLSRVLDGSETPFLKSAPPPVDQVGPIMEVVGSTYQELVLGSKRDTFIMFYSPWCGFCKSAMPVFDQVAAAMISGEAPLTVARFDVSRNRLPHGAPQITKLPTIYYIFGLDNSSVSAADDPVETSQKVDADFESDSDEAISQRLSTFINERKRQAENAEADAPKRRRPTALESRYQLFNSQRSFESLVEFASDCAARARSESILPATMAAATNADTAPVPVESKIDETPAPAAPVESPDLAVAPHNEAIPQHQHRVHDEL